MIVFAPTDSASSVICRIDSDDAWWRVKVESWTGSTGSTGRLVFEPEDALHTIREGPPVLSAESHEEIVRAAHELDEVRLRAVCRSLA